MRPRAPLLNGLLAAALAGCTPSVAAPVDPASAHAGATSSGMTLPRETIVTLDGAPTDLERVAQGRVALVSLWATWCEGCAKEFEALNRLSAGAASHDALVIGVAVGEPRATVEAFVQQHDVRYAQLVDEDFRFADALGQREVPATLVIDRTGRIVYRGEALDGRGLEVFRVLLSRGSP